MVLVADCMPIGMAVGGGDGDGHIVLGYRLRRVNRLWEREVRGRWRLARKRQRLGIPYMCVRTPAIYWKRENLTPLQLLVIIASSMASSLTKRLLFVTYSACIIIMISAFAAGPILWCSCCTQLKITSWNARTFQQEKIFAPSWHQPSRGFKSVGVHLCQC
jgi:hypothetical protein